MKQIVQKQNIARSFDRGAREYDQEARVQKKMVAAIEGMLTTSSVRAPVTRLLELGCGTGELTLAVRRLFPDASITAVDLSPEMLKCARKKLGSEGLQWVEGDAENPELQRQLGGGWDLIVSNATVQWFQEPTSTLTRYTEALAPGGRLLFSTFGSETFHELHRSFEVAERALGIEPVRHGREFPAVEAWRQFAREAARGQWEWREESLVDWYPTVRDFLRSVQRIGASHSNVAGGQTYLSRSVLHGMMLAYEEAFGREQGGRKEIPVTYHCIYGHYVKN